MTQYQECIVYKLKSCFFLDETLISIGETPVGIGDIRNYGKIRIMLVFWNLKIEHFRAYLNDEDKKRMSGNSRCSNKNHPYPAGGGACAWGPGDDNKMEDLNNIK